jgi:hypothetical protein
MFERGLRRKTRETIESCVQKGLSEIYRQVKTGEKSRRKIDEIMRK